MQKRTLPVLSAPHAGQRGARDAPQPPQKRAVVGFVCPQLAQAMATRMLARSNEAPGFCSRPPYRLATGPGFPCEGSGSFHHIP